MHSYILCLLFECGKTENVTLKAIKAFPKDYFNGILKNENACVCVCVCTSSCTAHWLTLTNKNARYKLVFDEQQQKEQPMKTTFAIILKPHK